MFEQHFLVPHRHISFSFELIDTDIHISYQNNRDDSKYHYEHSFERLAAKIRSAEVHIRNMDNSHIDDDDDGNVMERKHLSIRLVGRNRTMNKHLYHDDGGREDMYGHYCTKLDVDTFSLDVFHQIKTNSTTHGETY